MKWSAIATLPLISFLLLQGTSKAQVGFEMAVAQRLNANIVRLSYPRCESPTCVAENHVVDVKASEIEVSLLNGNPVRTSSFVTATNQPRVVLVTYVKREIPFLYRQALAKHVVIVKLADIPDERRRGGTVVETVVESDPENPYADMPAADTPARKPSRPIIKSRSQGVGFETPIRSRPTRLRTEEI